MLDIKKVESKNEVTICGLLNELDITPGTTTDGREYIRGRARIQVDQEINGEMVTSEVPVSMFAMKLKKDGTANKGASQPWTAWSWRRCAPRPCSTWNFSSRTTPSRWGGAWGARRLTRTGRRYGGRLRKYGRCGRRFKTACPSEVRVGSCSSYV